MKHTVPKFNGTTFVPCPGMYGGYVVQEARKAFKKKHHAKMEGDMKKYHLVKHHIEENRWKPLSIRQIQPLIDNYPQYFRIAPDSRHPKVWKFVRAGSRLFLTHVVQLT